MNDALCFIGAVWAAEVAEAVAPVAVVTVEGAWNQLLATALAALVPVIGVIGTYLVILVRLVLLSKIAKIKNTKPAPLRIMHARFRPVRHKHRKGDPTTKPTDGDPMTPQKAKDLLSKAYGRVKAQVTDDIMDIVKTAVKDSGTVHRYQD